MRQLTSWVNLVEKVRPFILDVTVVFLINLFHVCHFEALQGKTLGYPRKELLNVLHVLLRFFCCFVFDDWTDGLKEFTV